MTPTDFASGTPRLVIEEYFLGETRAYGLFEDRFGNVRRQFTVDITGRHEGDSFVLDEKFRFSDGETDRRVWTLVRTGENAYRGTADDVVGVAAGALSGNAFNLRYRLDMKVGGGRWRVDFDDWMFLQPDGILLNRARVSKWGVELGRVTISFRQLGAPAQNQARLRAAE